MNDQTKDSHQSSERPQYIAVCASGIEPLLEQELKSLGAKQVFARKQRVEFAGEGDTVYRVMLWSRLATRVLLPITSIAATSAEAYQADLKAIPWEDYFDVGSYFAIDVTGKNQVLHHSHYAALAAKDAVVDRFREETGERPSIDTEDPDVRIHVHVGRETAEVSLNLSGGSMHRRGYRLKGSKAPLTETLAAALVMRSGWLELLETGEATEFLDPMCGSGTLLIEAAMMAADIAPGLQRQYWGFQGWLDHKPAVWRRLMDEAEQRKEAGLAKLEGLRFTGTDIDPQAIEAAKGNIKRAGLGWRITVSTLPMQQAKPTAEKGLLVTNPPYGERIGEMSELVQLYSALGNHLKREFGGWKAAVFTGDEKLAQRIGLRAHRKYTFFNGPLRCMLLPFDIHAERIEKGPSAEAQEFTNRLKKNLKHLNKWAKRKGVTNYRLYDADLPHFALAVDLYRSIEGELYAHVQEYEAPSSIEPRKAEKRLREALAVIEETLEIDSANIALKVRAKQKGSQQYQKQTSARGQSDNDRVVEEAGSKFLVNLTDYLDTGLFLDHRPIRERIAQSAKGKRFLNLFCYTGAATIHAVNGGARETTSVDMSATYLKWAQRNLKLNVGDNVSPYAHRWLQKDCLQWLAEAAEDEDEQGRYDLIFFDPPTFSNSKRMETSFDVLRDHATLVDQAMALLAKDGLLLFSNNHRRFKLDAEVSERYAVKEITAKTIDEDFKRSGHIHRCWEIRAGD